MKKNYELITKNNGIDVIIKEMGNYNYWDHDYNYNYLEISYLNDSFDMKKMRVIPEQDKKISYRRMRNLTDSSADWRSRDDALYFISEPAITAAEKLLKKNLNSYNKKIKNGFNNPLFLLLKPIVDSKVKYYQSDFYRHDNLLLQSNPEKFIWIVRECGTWLIQEKSKIAFGIMDYCIKNSDDDDYYFYSNGKLQKVHSKNIMNFYNQLPE